MYRSPYAAPRAESDARPGVILWFRIYAAVMAIVSSVAAAFAVLYAIALTQQPIYGPSGGADAHLFAILLVLVAVPIAVLYVVATFAPRRPWGWTVGFVAIAMGVTSLAVVVAVPLLIAWLKPTTKAAFARL